MLEDLKKPARILLPLLIHLRLEGNGARRNFRSCTISVSTSSNRSSNCKMKKNIARGTTDPEIDSVTWTRFGNNMAPDDAACISCKFDHQMAPLALVDNLATR